MQRVVPLLIITMVFTLAPSPQVARGAPVVLTDVQELDALDGRGPVLQATFPIDYLGISWVGRTEPSVRFRRDGRWTPWREAHREGLGGGRRTFSSLVAGRRADAFQLRGRVREVRTLAMNTSDGPRPLRWGTPAAEASHVEPPWVVPRSGWGADESLRFAGARQRRRPSFAPVRKLIIHHTATPRWDPAPGAIRAIYRYHTLLRGWGDIGYHYLIAADGRIFKGRYSGPPGTRVRDRPAADRGRGWGVSGAHALGANRGTVGVALLGKYERGSLSPAARGSLVRLLAWLSARYGIDPTGKSPYRGSGRSFVTRNIAGHRAYGSSECPGEAVVAELPGIRRDVARALRAGIDEGTGHAPLISSVWSRRVGRQDVVLRWTTDRPSRSVVRFRAEGPGATWRRRQRPGLRTRHLVRLRPLRRSSSYVFRLGAVDAPGNRGWSAPGTFRTKG